MGLAGSFFEPQPPNFAKVHNFQRCTYGINMILISLLVSDFQIFAKAVLSRYRAVLGLVYLQPKFKNLYKDCSYVVNLSEQKGQYFPYFLSYKAFICMYLIRRAKRIILANKKSNFFESLTLRDLYFGQSNVIHPDIFTKMHDCGQEKVTQIRRQRILQKGQ